MQKSLYINADKCTGCLQCEMACSYENYGMFNPAKSRIKIFDFDHSGRKVPYTCTQCDEAWCLHACPVDAIKIDFATGAKVVHEDVCVGCKVCTIACPFGTINYVQDTGKVQKCDLCGGDPACAAACPTGAITYVDADWTGLERMKLWGQPKPATSRTRKEDDHVLDWKILRVNLTEGTCTPEPLNMKWARDYIGQRGLATKYFTEEVDAKVDPLSPQNKIIWATGPLTGTMASTGGRYSVITKGALTGAIACSNSGGYWGAELKMAGWDMIIFEGKASKPVYLFIENDSAQLLDADWLWGKTVWETEPAIKAKHQDPQIRVSSIGRAGETGCLYAAVMNDLHRAAGRSGAGTVMGSKNLKAIAVRGTKGVGNIRDPKAFMEAATAAKKVLADHAVTGQGLPKFGTQVLMNVINEVGALPTRNHRDVQFEGAKDISAEAMHTPRKTDGKANLVTNQACFGCTIACGRISKIDETHYTVQNRPKYWGASGGLEYEAAWALGAANGVNDLEALTYANFICNEDGFDPITFGATVGAVMELYEMGVLKKEQLGIEAPFGSPKALTYFAEITGRGEGFGKEIAQGSKRLTAKYGYPDLSMSVKGQEFPAYDSRGIQGMGLAYATSNRGACHLRGYTVASEILGIPVKTDPLVTEGKAGLVKAFQDATAVFDSAGICLFTSFAWTLANVQPQLAAACTDEFTLDELGLIGERIWNMERDFNNRAGFTDKDDTLPKRLLTEPAKTGPARGLVNGLDKMLPEYYQLRGWSDKGELKPDTRARLGL